MEAIEARVNIGLSQENLMQTVPTVGLIMHPESVRPMAKNVITAISKGISPNFVIPSNVENLLAVM